MPCFPVEDLEKAPRVKLFALAHDELSTDLLIRAAQARLFIWPPEWHVRGLLGRTTQG